MPDAKGAGVVFLSRRISVARVVSVPGFGAFPASGAPGRAEGAALAAARTPGRALEIRMGEELVACAPCRW